MNNKKEKKEPKVEYFTDDMHKEIFAFQEAYKNTKGSKPSVKTISLKSFKR